MNSRDAVLSLLISGYKSKETNVINGKIHQENLIKKFTISKI